MKRKFIKKKKDDEGKRNQNFFWLFVCRTLSVCLIHTVNLLFQCCLLMMFVCLFLAQSSSQQEKNQKSEIRHQRATLKKIFSFLLFLSLPLMCTKLVSCIFLTTIYPFNNYGETVFLKRVHD